MPKEENQALFLFAAKVGSLEGYLFERSKVEPLSNWIDNIENMYHSLPSAVKAEIDPLLINVLKRVLDYGMETLEPELRGRVEQLLRETSRPA